jgi:hypothetical protein
VRNQKKVAVEPGTALADLGNAFVAAGFDPDSVDSLVKGTRSFVATTKAKHDLRSPSSGRFVRHVRWRHLGNSLFR